MSIGGPHEVLPSHGPAAAAIHVMAPNADGSPLLATVKQRESEPDASVWQLTLAGPQGVPHVADRVLYQRTMGDAATPEAVAALADAITRAAPTAAAPASVAELAKDAGLHRRTATEIARAGLLSDFGIEVAQPAGARTPWVTWSESTADAYNTDAHLGVVEGI